MMRCQSNTPGDGLFNDSLEREIASIASFRP
jgi:hypothetical protein